MSLDWHEDLLKFHEEVRGEVFSTSPHIPTNHHKDLRLTLIREETQEALDALVADDLVEIADGIADAIWVLLGTAITYGIDLRPIWDEVCRANMTKKGGQLREDGKTLKPPGWQPPKIAEFLERQAMGW